VKVNAVLGLLLIVFCAVGIGLGIARLAPGRSAGELAVAVVAAAAGVAAFLVVMRVGRRGAPPWARWLIPLGLAGALVADKLPKWAQLAVLALGAGYVGAFVATIVVRVVRAPS
jgi:hypothetical protein